MGGEKGDGPVHRIRARPLPAARGATHALQAPQRGATPPTKRTLAFARRQGLDAELTDIRLLLAGMLSGAGSQPD